MINMQRFFKREEKRPFTYPSIEERKQNKNYTLWFISAVLVIAVSVMVFLLLK